MPSARPTHFLCLPLVTPASLPQFTASLAIFAQDKAIQRNSNPGRSIKQQPPLSRKKRSAFEADTSDEDIQPTASSEGYIPIKAIRPVGTLHLTLGVMSLDSKNKIDAASEFLKATNIDVLVDEAAQISEQDLQHLDPQPSIRPIPSSSLSTETSILQSSDPTDCSTSNPGPTQLVIQLKGLHSMQQARKTRVLYAEPIDASNRLYPFCRQLRDKFIHEGFIMDEERDLKLHATIVNTIYASKQGRSSTGKSRVEFDASDLIERWKDKIWAEVSIDKVAICEMGAKEDTKGQVKYLEVAERVFGS